MTLQQSNNTLEDLLLQIDSMALELQGIRDAVEALLKEGFGRDSITGAEEMPKASIVNVLEGLPSSRSFQSAEEVDRYLLEERASWDI